MPQLIQAVNEKLQPIMATWPAGDKRRTELKAYFRHAEGAILEGIYQKEHQEEQRQLRNIKISLYLSPLILPLIYTVGLLGYRYFKMNRQNYSVTKKEISLDSLEEVLNEKSEEKFKNKLPIIEKDNKVKLRKAVVLNPHLQGLKRNYHSIFHGMSQQDPDATSKMKSDAVIYRPKK